MESLFALFNRVNDHIIPHLMAMQLSDPLDPEYGAILKESKGFAEPSTGAGCSDAYLSAYYSPESRYYHDAELLRRAELALDSMLRFQHEDGSLDLIETNFHDATSNGFTVQILGYTHRMMKQQMGASVQERRVFDKLHLYLQRSASAMISGGFHTPNHRWVLSSALSLCWHELSDDCCRQMLQLYLDEGIDCDEEGEYTERSAGLYDVVCNQSMMILATELDMPELIENALRNLDKQAHYMEPDGSVVTLNSRRQDHGKKIYPFKQLLTCLSVLAYPHDPNDVRYQKVAGLAQVLTKQYEQHMLELHVQQDAGNFVTRILLAPALGQEHPSLPIETVYNRFGRKSGVVRVRQGEMSLTLMENNSIFMKLQNGELEMMLRLASTFYACGKMICPKIQEIPGGYRLQCSNRWGYKRPLGKEAGTSHWEDMPHEKRGETNMLKLTWTVDVLISPDKVTMRLKADGCDHLPWKLECLLTPDGMLKLDGGFVPGRAGQYAIAGNATYQRHGDSITLTGSTAEHVYTATMRNSDPPVNDAFTLYTTGFAPMEQEITFTWKNQL